MKNITSNINPTVFSWSAIVVGTILCEELNVLEQNAIGNWIILLGDYLLTNAAQVAVIQSDNNDNSNNNNNNNQPLNDDEKMDALQKAIKKIEDEIANLKGN